MIETERLVLRNWIEADRTAWREMMADPDVGYWLGGALSPAAIDEAFGRMSLATRTDGFGIWATERKADRRMIGAIGVRRIPEGLGHPFGGEVEVAWRLAPRAWGQGYATEAAAASIAWGFANLDIDEIVAFTAVSNIRSQAVMQRLGLTRAPQRDFNHPTLPEDHPLRPHVVYVSRRPG